MRSTYPHLPNPTMFDAKRHKRKNYWQKLISEPGMTGAVFALAVFVIGFAISASLH